MSSTEVNIRDLAAAIKANQEAVGESKRTLRKLWEEVEARGNPTLEMSARLSSEVAEVRDAQRDFFRTVEELSGRLLIVEDWIGVKPTDVGAAETLRGMDRRLEAVESALEAAQKAAKMAYEKQMVKDDDRRGPSDFDRWTMEEKSKWAEFWREKAGLGRTLTGLGIVLVFWLAARAGVLGETLQAFSGGG